MTDSGKAQCRVCGTAKSGWLGDNCPACLMGLGDGHAEASPCEDVLESPLEAASTRYIGDYELLEEIARGGMGVVYRARQVSLNRTVAVKLLLGGHFANETFAKRFRHEAQAAASLNHPNIVSIHEIGEHQGQPYFSMALIEGRSLAELVRDKPLPARRAAELLKTIAETVHFAHERGLLHRDLKPSNVIVDALDVPYVTDFGLAKRVQEDAELTLPGQLLGTPNYMPPEQADPKRGPLTPASDVYSMGAILYQLLTAHPPFIAESVTQTLRLVAESEPVSPRLVNPSVPRDLETICCKCLEKEPQRRYSSARELADELGRYMRDEPIYARPIAPTAKVLRWFRRKPAFAAAVVIAVTLLLIVAIGSPIAMLRIEAARKQEAALRGRAELAERQTEQQLYTALLGQAHGSVQSRELGQRVQALDAIRRAAAISNSAELRREAVAAFALPDLRFERELPTPPDCTLVAVDPKFERMALGRGTNVVEIRSVPDQRLLATLPARTTDLATFGKWSPDGRFLAICRRPTAGALMKNLEVWDLTSLKLRFFRANTPWDAFSFHPTAGRVLVPANEGLITLYDLENRKELNQFAVTGSVHHVEFSPDGNTFIAHHRVGGQQYQEGVEWYTSLFEVNVRSALSSTVTAWIDDIAWHPSGRWVAFATRSGQVHLHDQKTRTTTVLGRHKQEARTAVFSPDGQFLFTGGEEQEIICWDLRSMRSVMTIGLQSASVQFSGDGQRCAVPTRTGVRIHQFEHAVPYRELRGDLGSGVNRGAFSPDGRWLAAAGTDGLGLWDLTRDAPARTTNQLFNPPTPLFSRDSSELLFFWLESITRWRITAAEEPDAPPQVTSLPIYNPGRLSSAAFFNHGLMLGIDYRAVLLPKAQIASGPGQAFPVQGDAGGRISPNGSWMAFRKGHRETIHTVEEPKPIGAAQLESEILAEAFTPLSDELAVATRNCVVFLDTNRWQPQRRFPVALDRNAQIIFTPDQSAFWLVHDARTAVLHDARTFERLLPLPSGIIPLAFSPDGRYFAVSVDSRRVQLWDFTELQKQLRALGLGW